MSDTLQFGHSMRAAALPAEHRRRQAAAIQQNQRLLSGFAASSRWRSSTRPLRITSGPCSAYSWRMSTTETDASGRSCTRRSITSRVYRALAAFWLLSSDGVAEPSTTSAPSLRAAHDRHVAPVVARRLLLLERRIVLFVDDDQPEFVERRKHGRARADDDRHLAPADAIPLIGALAVGQAAVLHRHAIAERVAKRRRHGGRQRDLRDEHEHRPAAAQDEIGEPKVHLRLARSGDALQQEHRKLSRRRRRARARPTRSICSPVSTRPADG